MVGEGGELIPHAVRTGRGSGQLLEILAGLAEGDRIVSAAAFLVDAESNLGTMTGDLEVEGDSVGAMPGMDHSQH